MFACIFCGISGSTYAQSDSPRIEEREPSIIYLPVKEGEIREGGALERVIDLPAEAFRKWFKEVYLNRNSRDLPKYTFESVSARVEIEGQYAQMDMTFRITPYVNGWVEIPLGLKYAIFRSEQITAEPAIQLRPNHPSDHSEAEGYSIWCKIPDGYVSPLSTEIPEPITLSAEFVVPISRRGEEFVLDTSLPAQTKCTVDFYLPKENTILAQKGSMIFRSRISNDGKIVQPLETAGGPLQLQWRFDNQVMEEARAELEVKGKLTSSVLSEETVGTVAELEVKSLMAPFDSFVVEIDDHAQFVPPTEESTDYKIRVLEKNGALVQNRLLVELPVPTLGPVNVVISTRQTDPVPGDRGKRKFSIGRFNVVDSKIQSGTLALNVAGNVHVSWDTPRIFRERNSSLVQENGTQASFAYDQQPAVLDVFTLPIQTTARVKADYDLFLGNQDSQVRATLTYRLPRSYRDDLLIEMNGWEVDTVNTHGADQWQVIEGPTDQLLVPVANALGNDVMVNSPYQTVVFTVDAHIDHAAPNAENLILPWIVPRAEPLGSGSIAVIPDRNIRVRFRSESSIGFQLDRSRSQEAGLKGDDGRIVLRGNLTEPNLQLGLQFEKVTPRIIVEGQYDVALVENSTSAKISQQWLLEPFHTELSTWVLNIPDGISPLNATVVEINGKKVAGEIRADGKSIQFDMEDLAPPFRMQLNLDTQLVADEINAPEFELPLVTPNGEALESQGIEVEFKPTTFSFDAPRGMEILSNAEKWPSLEDTSKSVSIRLFEAPPEKIRIAAPFISQVAEKPAIIDFHWLQIGLTPTDRRDRAVYRIRTTTPDLVVQLPNEAEHTNVYWNDVEAEFTSLGKNKIRIVRPEIERKETDHLEIWYDFPNGAGISTSLRVQSPKIEGAVLGNNLPGMEGGHTYLQVVTPGNWMLLSAPALSEEMDWTWDEGRYRRVPRLNQAQLERLATATKQRSSYPEGMNRYLYSTVGPIEGVRLSAVKSSHLLMAFSGVAMLFLLLLFYLPVIRHTLLLGGVAVVAVGTVLVYPDFAILVSEMSALGIMLALLGMVLYLVASYRVPARPIARTRGADSQSVPPETTTGSSVMSPVSTASVAAVGSNSGNSP